MVSRRAKMCIPESYSGPPLYLESIQTTTNVTPRGTFVDLHMVRIPSTLLGSAYVQLTNSRLGTTGHHYNHDGLRKVVDTVPWSTQLQRL